MEKLPTETVQMVSIFLANYRGLYKYIVDSGQEELR